MFPCENRLRQIDSQGKMNSKLTSMSVTEYVFQKVKSPLNITAPLNMDCTELFKGTREFIESHIHSKIHDLILSKNSYFHCSY